MTRYCASCQQQRPLREFDLGGGQLSKSCLECAHARMNGEDQLARSQRTAQIAALEKRHRELVAELVKVDAQLADLRPRPRPQRRPKSPRIVLDDGAEVDDAVFGEDLGDHTRDEMS